MHNSSLLVPECAKNASGGVMFVMKRNLLSHMALNGRKLEGFVLYPDAWTNAAVHSRVHTVADISVAIDIGHSMRAFAGIS